MSKPTLIYDPNAGSDVAANLDFAADGLTVFGGNGRKLQHWPYAEIVHAYPSGASKDEFLAHTSRPEIRLQVRNEAIYKAIRERAPQLRPLRRGWRTFWKTMEGMPNEARLGIVVLVGVVVFAIYRFAAGVFD
jgi:hypothetical protein